MKYERPYIEIVLLETGETVITTSPGLTEDGSGRNEDIIDWGGGF